MSVPVNQRSHGKLEACVKAHDLCVYTIKITANKKHFKEEYQSFTSKIENAAIDIHSKAWTANNIFVNDAESFHERRRLQTEAIAQCNILLSYIDIAKSLFHLDSKRVRYWGEKAIETKNLIRAWRDSESKRNAEYK